RQCQQKQHGRAAHESSHRNSSESAVPPAQPAGAGPSSQEGQGTPESRGAAVLLRGIGRKLQPSLGRPKTATPPGLNPAALCESQSNNHRNSYFFSGRIFATSFRMAVTSFSVISSLAKAKFAST